MRCLTMAGQVNGFNVTAAERSDVILSERELQIVVLKQAIVLCNSHV